MLDPNSKIEQCLYTGCGKDCSGAFGVWSQSSGLYKEFYSDKVTQRGYGIFDYLQYGKSLKKEKLEEIEKPLVYTSKKLKEGAKPSGLFRKTYKDSDFDIVETQMRSGITILDESVKGNLDYDDYADFDFRENPEQAPYRIIAYTDDSNHLVVIRRSWIGQVYSDLDGRSGNMFDHVMYFPEGTKIEDIDVKKLPFVKGLQKKYFRTQLRPNDPFEPAPKNLEPIDAGKMMAGGYVNTNAAKQTTNATQQQTSAPQTNIPKQPQQAPQQPQQNAPKTQPTTTQQTAQSQPDLSVEARAKQLFGRARNLSDEKHIKFEQHVSNNKISKLISEQIFADEVSKLMTGITDTELMDYVQEHKDDNVRKIIDEMSPEECQKTLGNLNTAMSGVKDYLARMTKKSEADINKELEKYGWAGAEFELSNYISYREQQLLGKTTQTTTQTTTQQQQPAPQPTVRKIKTYDDYVNKETVKYNNTFLAAKMVIDQSNKLFEIKNKQFASDQAKNNAIQNAENMLDMQRKALAETLVGLSSEDLREIERIAQERKEAIKKDEINYAAEQNIAYSFGKTQESSTYQAFDIAAKASQKENRTRSSSGPTM